MALLEVEDLKVHYPVRGGLFRPKRFVRAVDGVSFRMEPGETVGLVGESGCGKSTLGKALVRLEKPAAGRVLLNGLDMSTLRGRELRRARKNFQMIFQDPYGSLNPRLTVFSALDEVLALHFPLTKAERRERAAKLLDRSASPPARSTAIRTSSPADSGSGSASPGAGCGTGADRRRRTGFGAGCERAGRDHQSARGYPARNRNGVSVHRARPCGGRAYFVADSGHVSRAGGRVGSVAGAGRPAVSSVHEGASFGGARDRRFGEAAHRAAGGCAVAARSRRRDVLFSAAVRRARALPVGSSSARLAGRNGPALQLLLRFRSGFIGFLSENL